MKYLKGVVAELKAVDWPTFKRITVLTFMIIVFIIVMSTLIWGMDMGFSALLAKVIGGGK